MKAWSIVGTTLPTEPTVNDQTTADRLPKRHAAARNLAKKQQLKETNTLKTAPKKVAAKPKGKKVSNLASFNKSPPGVHDRIQFYPLGHKHPMSGPSGATYKSPPTAVPEGTGKGVACTPSRIGLVGDGRLFIVAKE